MAINANTEALRGLPSHADDTWQGGVLTIPGGKVVGDDGRQFTPVAFLWISTATGRIHLGGVGPASAVTPAVVVSSLVAFATNATLAGYRPGRVEVADPAHAAAVAGVVGPLGVTVDVVGQLAGVAFMADHLAKSMQGGMATDGGPEALSDDPAITPDRLAGFAAAAAAFFAARPWQHFGPNDLVRVAAPSVPKLLRFFNVMGGGGEQFGLAFFASAAAYKAMVESAEPGEYAATHPMVSVTFDVAGVLPPGDVADWKRHKLPTSKLGRKVMYPLPATFNRGVWLRPTAAELATMEGLLSGVAALTPADLAAGRWSADVATADGTVAFTFELQRVGNPVFDLNPFAPFAGLADPPATEAERLVEQAWDAGGGRGAALARRAVAADPDAVDAYVILGDTAPDAATATDHYRQGIAAGERKLGPRFFKENGGMFWGIMETRPYMRALAGLANALRATGRPDEAVDVWQRMLDLNPNDNQGVRDLLAAVLLELGRDAELSALFARFERDAGVVHGYAAALLRFRAEGDSPAAVERLRSAVTNNAHMVPYLTGKTRPPRHRPATYSPGEPTEAQAFASDLIPAWRATPGAVDWLASHTAAAAKPKPTVKRRQPKPPA